MVIRLNQMLSLCLSALFCLSASAQSFSGPVVAVSDGDTIKVLQGRDQITIRLAEIDCPEKSQAFGQRAKQATSDLAFGKTVTVEPEKVERYGRTVARVILPDGRVLNEELLRLGMAWWYSQFSKDKRLSALQAEAMASRVGLWVDPRPIPPWDFRHGKDESPTDSSEPQAVIKLSRSGICHIPGSTWYAATTHFTSFGSLEECIKAGGRGL